MSSLRRTDILALSHLREDGRQPNEIRRVRIQLGPLLSSSSSYSGTSGSALMEMGLTVALATVRGPTDCVRRSEERSDRAILDVTMQVAPFAPASGDRRSVNPNTDRRLIEASQWLKRALEATLLLHLYPKSRIEVVVSILQDDGGRLCAALNAASLACIEAGLAMKDMVVACSAGYAASSASGLDLTLIDLNRREESGQQQASSAPQVPCAMLPQRGTLVLVQSEARLPNFETMERVLEAAREGCLALFEIMQAAVRERAAALLRARASSSQQQQQQQRGVEYGFAPSSG